MATATLAGGCFWCLEAVFQGLRGVLRVVPGYAGGVTQNPTYEQVCTGRTGHAEAVRIDFDPNVITFRDLLEVFFAAHDPTTLNRQGADVGTQYRSAVFYHDDGQKAEAERVIADLGRAGRLPGPVVTEVVPFTAFYPAEERHRDYYRLNPDSPYCRLVISPKLAKLRREYAASYWSC
ncbi:MAG: peptide-methionine (S)-S-oxide reductase MsrA [Patescibacteria group bacterium]